MLSEIKKYLAAHEQASVCDVAIELNVPAEVARAALDVWVQKGKASRIEIESRCQAGCGKPCSERPELYRWIDRVTPSA